MNSHPGGYNNYYADPYVPPWLRDRTMKICTRTFSDYSAGGMLTLHMHMHVGKST